MIDGGFRDGWSSPAAVSGLKRTFPRQVPGMESDMLGRCWSLSPLTLYGSGITARTGSRGPKASASIGTGCHVYRVPWLRQIRMWVIGPAKWEGSRRIFAGCMVANDSVETGSG